MRKIQSTFAALTVALLCIACSTNPATGKREFNIVSEGQEVAMGRQTHPQIIREFGVYDEKPELNRLVDRIGKEIAAKSERPTLPWTFTVLDTPMVNAMALPGGYIYITRGMLERVNSEDELAGVIGHEIAHVTARHAAQQISRSQLAQVGLVLGAVIAGPQAIEQYGQLAELGLGLLFQRYSRGQETQADLLGTGYMAEARFNPIGAERMLMTLQRLDKNPASGLDRYFMSHPDPAKRVREVRQKVAEIGGMTSAGTFDPPDRTSFVRMLDGIITANSTEHMVIKDGTIYDRGHGLVIRAPQGWTATTQPGVLFAMQPRGQKNPSSYFVAQEIDLNELQGRTVEDAVRLRLQQMGLSFAGSRRASAATGQDFVVDVWQGQTQAGVVGVETTQFRHGDHVAVFLFVSPSVNSRNSPLATVLRNIEVSHSRANSVEPPRMHVGTVRQGDTWNTLARRATGNSNDAEAIANINGFDLNTRPAAGMTVKLPEDVARDE
ncbi:MAG TPA: M48 family metalloprotease [Thermoanaerobaculia bacterium]|nr:M48 family metalloprotease [Thermoanaerobaculia bacterium]